MVFLPNPGRLHIPENEVPGLSGTFPRVLQDFSGPTLDNVCLTFVFKLWRMKYQIVSISSVTTFDISIHLIDYELLHVGKVKRT